jgi:Asp-tRNA(Asn)/Glu-tRNA(Gln) amidotransferase C subunit
MESHLHKIGEEMTTETDQINEMSFRSDEQAQSQDRERLQSEIQEAWDNYFWHDTATEADIKLLKWALGVK